MGAPLEPRSLDLDPYPVTVLKETRCGGQILDSSTTLHRCRTQGESNEKGSVLVVGYLTPFPQTLWPWELHGTNSISEVMYSPPTRLVSLVGESQREWVLNRSRYPSTPVLMFTTSERGRTSFRETDPWTPSPSDTRTDTVRHHHRGGVAQPYP